MGYLGQCQIRPFSIRAQARRDIHATQNGYFYAVETTTNLNTGAWSSLPVPLGDGTLHVKISYLQSGSD